MESRRLFLKKGVYSMIAIQVPFMGCSKSFAATPPRNILPKTAAVVWYSQTGHTERVGRLVEATLQKSGIQTVASDYRSFDKNSLGSFDIVIAGSPVYYYDVPTNFQNWLKTAPNLNHASVASYVTYGGEGGNQHNTSRALAGLLAEKGGIPVGTAEFGNMSTFAITWSTGNVKRILKYSDKPDETTFQSIRHYTETILKRIKGGVGYEIDKEIDFRDLFRSGPSIWGTKLLISRHSIDTEKCIDCGTCMDKCPVNAIDTATGAVRHDACIACLGCINNCPVGAVDMGFMGKTVYGFNTFIEQNNITIQEPEELRPEKGQD